MTTVADKICLRTMFRCFKWIDTNGNKNIPEMLTNEFKNIHDEYEFFTVNKDLILQMIKARQAQTDKLFSIEVAKATYKI